MRQTERDEKPNKKKKRKGLKRGIAVIVMILALGLSNYAAAEAVSAEAGPAFRDGSVVFEEEAGATHLLVIPGGTKGVVAFSSDDESVVSIERSVATPSYTYAVRCRVEGAGRTVIRGELQDGSVITCEVEVGDAAPFGETSSARVRSSIMMQATAGLVSRITECKYLVRTVMEKIVGGGARVTSFGAEEAAFVCRYYAGLSYSSGDLGKVLDAKRAEAARKVESAMAAVIARDKSSASTGAISNAVKTGTQVLKEIRFGSGKLATHEIRKRADEQ